MIKFKVKIVFEVIPLDLLDRLYVEVETEAAGFIKNVFIERNKLHLSKIKKCPYSKLTAFSCH
jgi:hypothetical protein